jgi:DNA-directed RNA polymerase specialized sigma24 family protein
MSRRPPSAARTSRRWDLNQDALARLLAALGSDELSASRRYEALRKRLIDLFAWERSDNPEESADDTLNRLAKRISEGVSLEGDAVERYCFGIARLVLLEEVRSRRTREAAHEEFSRHASAGPESDLIRRLERCLEELPPDSRELIRRYYSEDREALARTLGLSLNALRNRALRIRERLYECTMRDDRDV